MQVLKITSRDNPHIKRAKRIRDGKEAGMIFLEGLRLVDEAARSRTAVESVFVTDEVLTQLDASHISAWLRPGRMFEVTQSLLESIADTEHPQGIIATAECPAPGPEKIEEYLRESIPLVVFLQRISNPSNLGAVIRTAEAAGVAGVIVSDGSAEPFSPKALRAAMGSNLRLPIWSGVKIDDAVHWAREHNLKTIAADVSGTRSYTEVDWSIPRMLIMGSEAHGLEEEDLAKVEDLAVIPMAREVESLNLGVACAVIMFEARRQNAIH